MKKSRRQELKTNELSVYLQQGYEFIRKNATYLIGGTVIVVLILVVSMVNLRGTRRARAEAYQVDTELRFEDPTDEVLDRAREHATAFSKDATLAVRVRETYASKATQKALMLSEATERERKIELLKEALSVHEGIVRDFGNRADAVARAKWSIATISDSLAALGEMAPQQVRALYEAVADSATSPYRGAARDILDGFDVRFEELKVVTTRPAADTQPAVATIPPAGQEPTADAEGPGDEAASSLEEPIEEPEEEGVSDLPDPNVAVEP